MSKEIAVLGGGCFWCTEAVFDELNGILTVVPGYAGGDKPNPTYDEVCSGSSGHAEVVRVEFDPAVIAYKVILEVFFASHNPTTLNRQGNDMGEQYRSVIFYTTETQKKIAEDYIKELNSNGVWDAKIVTQAKPLDTFYEAEDYHHKYFKRNPDQAYCQAIINPKLDKFRAKYSSLLKNPTTV